MRRIGHLVSRFVILAMLASAVLGACGPEPPPAPTPAEVVLAPTDTAGRVPTATLLPGQIDPALSDPPAGYKLYNSPYWAAMYYPETWVQVYDEQPGDILLATENFGLYSGSVPEAVFQIWPLEQGDPLAGLQQAIEPALEGDLDAQLDVKEGSRTYRLAEEPEAVVVNGQEAATAAIVFPRVETDFDWDTSEMTSTEAGLLLEWITVVKGPDRRAVVQAYCSAERQDQYKPIFDTMLNSLILRQGPDDPVIGNSGTPPPAGYAPYVEEYEGISLSHPSEWTAEWGEGELFVAPPGEPWQEQRFGRLEAFVREVESGTAPDQVLLWFVSIMGYMSSAFHDAVVVTDVVTAERDGQGMARALFSGTVEGEPALGIVTVVQQGGRAAIAVAYVRNEAGLPELGRIMDTLALPEPVRAAPIPLTAGQIYTGTLEGGREVNYTLSCRVNVPVAVILKTWTEDAVVRFVDAKGVEVDRELAMILQDSVEPGVLLVEPEEDGSCGVTVEDLGYNDPFTYTLQMVEAPAGSPAVRLLVDGELPAGQKAEHSFQAAAGERLIVAVHPAAGQCAYLGFEILDESGEQRADSHYYYAGCEDDDDPAKALYFVPVQEGSYTVRIEEANGEPMRYRLYILRIEPIAGQPEPTQAVLAPTGAPTPKPAPTGSDTPEPTAGLAGPRIAFYSVRDGNIEIYIMNADGTAQTRLTDNPAQDGRPACSPDGARIAFASNRDGNWDVYQMNADGSAQTRLTDNPADDAGPAWSPDGGRIAFRSARDGNPEIYVMNADGTDQTRLTQKPAEDGVPAWSPDGTHLAFSSTRDGNWEIYVMSVNGSGQINLTNNPAGDFGCAWSPGGSRIVFSSDRDGNAEIYVMNADGTGQTRLTYEAAEDSFPAWSPDGLHIAFVSRRDGNAEIYVMNADGTGQTRLTDHLAEDALPAWCP